MPKSKRNRPVTLSKTKKKGREHKENVVNAIREAVEKYDSVYVFTFENMRNLKFKEFREQLKSSSRFFLGSNKVMQVALGRSVADELRPGLHKISTLVRGDSGLCFTSLPKEEVQRNYENSFAMPVKYIFFPYFGSPIQVNGGCNSWLLLLFYQLFNEYEEYDFARTGTLAAEKVELKEGPLDQFTLEMEPFLRKQGMPVRLNKGTIELLSDFVVCEEGQALSPESARILRLLGIKMATFRLHLTCRLTSEEFEVYREGLEDSDVESS